MAAINEKRGLTESVKLPASGEVVHDTDQSRREENKSNMIRKSQMEQHNHINVAEFVDLKEQLRKVQEANRLLSETIGKQETRNNEINAKLQKYKTFQKCFKHSMSSQCKFCFAYYPTEIFLEHVKTCSKDLNNFTRSHFFQIKLECQINDTLL